MTGEILSLLGMVLYIVVNGTKVRSRQRSMQQVPCFICDHNGNLLVFDHKAQILYGSEIWG